MSLEKFALIIVPYELGRHRQGVGCGPEHLISHGAIAALASNGAAVRASTVALDGQFIASGSGEADAAFELMRLVAGEVRRAREASEVPVVLSGSCFTAVGTVAGLNEAAPGVVWFDAHPDFSEPATTTSGYFDSMGLSVLTGGAWQAMLATIPSARPVPEQAVILAGARAFDPSEEARLKASQIRRLTCEDLRTPRTLIDAVRDLSPKITGLYVHIDLDVIDKQVAGVNVFSADGGLAEVELDGLLAALLETFPVLAVTLSAYDPAYDNENRVPRIAQRLLRTIAGRM